MSEPLDRMVRQRPSPGSGAGVSWLHTGGCAACAESLESLAAPRYAPRLRALGVTLTRQPRQSDIVLLCGALTPQALEALRPVLADVPQPHALVAVGACAINQCVFAGSPALARPLAQALDVNVEIGGCPPTPDAILDAIAEARRLLFATPDRTSDAALDPIAGAPHDPVAENLPVALDEPGGATEIAGMAKRSPEPSTAVPQVVDAARRDRLAALIAAARGSWDDEDEPGELAGDEFEQDDGDVAPDGLCALDAPHLPPLTLDALPQSSGRTPDGAGPTAHLSSSGPSDPSDLSDSSHARTRSSASDRPALHAAPSTPQGKGARRDARRGDPREENSR